MLILRSITLPGISEAERPPLFVPGVTVLSMKYGTPYVGLVRQHTRGCKASIHAVKVPNRRYGVLSSKDDVFRAKSS